MIIQFVVWTLAAQLAAALHVEISRFDVFENSTLTKPTDITATTAVDAEVKSLCEPLFRNTSHSEMNRCVAMASHTIRDYKMQSIRDSAEQHSLHFQHEVTDLALQYGHEQTSGRRVCMVGSPKLESILTVLSTSSAREVLILLDPKNVEHLSSYKEAVQSMATALNKRVDVLVGDAEALLSVLQEQSQRRLCDVLHLDAISAPSGLVTGAPVSSDNAEHEAVTRLIHAASRTPGGGDIGEKTLVSQQQQGPLRVVWVRAVSVPLVSGLNGASLLVTLRGHQYAPYNLTSALAASSTRALNQRTSSKTESDLSGPLVQWKVSSLWVQHSRLNPIANHDGFTGRTYVAHDPEGDVQQLTEVLVGEVERFPPPGEVLKNGVATAEARVDPLTGEAVAADRACSCPSKTTVIAITYTIRVFAETADGLRQALHSLGFQHVYVVPDLTLAAVNHLQDVAQGLRDGTCNCSSREASKQPAPLVLQVALGPHDFTMLLPHYIAFQMEQTWSSVAFAGRYKTRYGLVLSNALCILAYSHLHAALLRELGYPCVHVVPMYSLPAESERLRTIAETGHGTSLTRSDISSRTFDLSFYGGCSERRTRLLQEVQQQFPKCPATPSPLKASTDTAARCFEYSLHCVGWYTGVFDATRLLHVLQSRLVLNLHTDENSVLEAHRINYLLSLGRCVISERSDDTLLDARYAGVVHFINEGDISALHTIATRLLSNTTELQLCEQNSRDLYTRLSADTQDLGIAVDAAIQQIINEQ